MTVISAGLARSQPQQQLKIPQSRLIELQTFEHSRGRQPCLLEQKNKKIAQLHSIGLVHQHERRFIVLGHKYGCRDFM